MPHLKDQGTRNTAEERTGGMYEPEDEDIYETSWDMAAIDLTALMLHVCTGLGLPTLHPGVTSS